MRVLEKKVAPKSGTGKSAIERADRNLSQSALDDPDEPSKPHSPNEVLDTLIPDDQSAWPPATSSQPEGKKKKGAAQSKKKQKSSTSEKTEDDKKSTTPEPGTKTDAMPKDAQSAPGETAAEPTQQPDNPKNFADAHEECIKFLTIILELVKTSHPNIDAYNRFGLNLYIAGSCDYLAQTYSLNQEEKRTLISQALEVIDTPPEQARQLADKLDIYRKEERYRTMIAAGLGTIRSYISGEADPRMLSAVS